MEQREITSLLFDKIKEWYRVIFMQGLKKKKLNSDYKVSVFHFIMQHIAIIRVIFPQTLTSVHDI